MAANRNFFPAARSPFRALERGRAVTFVWSAVISLTLLFLICVLVRPDPDGRLIWARAQQLEAANLIRPALRQYNLLADTYPASPYALKALQREGDILTDLATAGDTARFVDALDVYARLVRNYPQTEIAADALLATGKIQLENLKNPALARATYTTLLNEYPRRRALAAQAMNALGRVAQAARDSKTAQKWFQSVLQMFPEQPERCAEAQFRLGETYETLWRKKEWARNAYDTTIQRYPDTAWAGHARENLGLLIYGEMVPNARRVLIKTGSAFDTFTENDAAQNANDALLNALGVVLAARGVRVDATILRGWSQTPFVAAFDPRDPSRAAAPNLNAFENAVAATGMTYSVSDGGDRDTARRTLQNEIDTGHLALVFAGRWQLVAGYDSSQNVVFLQDGARVQTVGIEAFLKSWNARSPLGAEFTLVTFSSGADDLRAARQNNALPIERILAPRRNTTSRTRSSTRNANDATLPNPVAAEANPVPADTQISQQPRSLIARTWVFTPPSLNEKAVYRRAARHAVLWMKRARSGNTLLNLAALRELSAQWRRLGASTPLALSTPLANEPLARQNISSNADNNAPGNAVSSTPDAASDAATNSATSNAVGSVTNSAATQSSTRLPSSSTLSAAAPNAALASPSPDVSAMERARALLGWRAQPLTQWLDARRDAAAFLDVAGDKLASPSLKQAAQSFEQAIVSLQNAQTALDALAALDANGNLGQDGALSPAARQFALQAANALDDAGRQETQATAQMATI